VVNFDQGGFGANAKDASFQCVGGAFEDFKVAAFDVHFEKIGRQFGALGEAVVECVEVDFGGANQFDAAAGLEVVEQREVMVAEGRGVWVAGEVQGFAALGGPESDWEVDLVGCFSGGAGAGVGLEDDKPGEGLDGEPAKFGAVGCADVGDG